MSNGVVIGLAVLCVVTNLYWWRRTNAIEDALRTSLERDERVRNGETNVTESATAEVLLHRAANRADCPPSELPERIGTLRERIGEGENELARVRRAWAKSWLDARRRACNTDAPHVLTGRFENATTDDIQTIAEYARECPREVGIFVATSSGAVCVSVGDDLTETVSAADIIDDICANAGGGGGGTELFATGGGMDPTTLSPVVEDVREELATRLSRDSSE